MDAPLPRARRLNRNAAVAAALMAGAMLLVVGSLVTSAPEIGDRPAAAPGSGGPPQAPTFLERAPIPPPAPDRDLAALLDPDAASPVTEASYDPAGPGSYGVPDPYAVQYAGAAEVQPVDPQGEARDRALAAGILSGGAGVATESGGPGELAAALPELPGGSRLLQASVHAAGSRYEIAAGTVIHAVLVSAVDSDAPADAVAQVTHDVYDRSMRRVLIPRASRLLGRPAGGATLGQRRLALVWHRLVMPDGRTVLLPEVPSQDASGAGAHRAEVDSHAGTTMRNALLLSMVGAGAQLSQPQQSATFGQAPSVGQVMAGAAGTQIAQVSGEMIRRGMDIRPTLSLPQGTPIQLLLTGDLALDPYP